ncbi:hypothetical protein [Phycisphaera mikurensis]|uniref:Uncharacterized protein n=1 Tax=Phycisphaera mikurensis (strain NBRC 102666 / KCTC 22515 / FYK2301M01) TaxID=1142394 RepID=I0IBU3_PHYMF|nr:hypothetical protein [Phycisphaera mikurensis]MBB6442041.1 hypothetical protein [Phycisphaera mikurensis]BAM02731.1 hypothetical protein PSMK_05720 [Phycisphaera mikurensis NBRC 102666]
MKEQITLRLYDDPATPPACDDRRYRADPKAGGAAYERGDTIGLDEREGGRLFGVIDRVDDEVLTDESGSYRLAWIWTQD